MNSRFSLDRAVFNSGKTRFVRPEEFTSMPRLVREPPARRTARRSAWRFLPWRALRQG
jgi:hypothetical protein